MKQPPESHQCYRIKQAHEAENAAAERHMARQVMRTEDTSEGVTARAPRLRVRIKRSLCGAQSAILSRRR
jgi:hypothetical protein